MYYTNIGNTKAKPGWIKSDGAKAPQVPIVNSTTKVMVQVSKEFCSKKDWETGKGNPGALFRDIYARWQVTKFIVHTFRPRKKEFNGGEYLEQVVLIQNIGGQAFLRPSGKDGCFTREFMDRNADGTIPQSAYRIVWLGTGVSLETALHKLSLIGESHVGLVCGKSGLGLRVRGADFQKVGELVYGDDWQGITADACFYEVSHVPNLGHCGRFDKSTQRYS